MDARRQQPVAPRGPEARGIDRPGRRSRLTRRVLVEAALSLLDEQGVEGLTVRAVTARADVGHGTFYHHFPSTEALLAEALEHSLRELAREMERGFADAPDKLWVFVASLTRMLRMLVAHPALAWMVGRPLVLAGALRDACGPFAARDVRAMVEAGLVSHELPVAMRDLWPWMIVGVLVEVEAGRSTLAEMEESLLRFLLLSLGLDPSRTGPVLARLGYPKSVRAGARKGAAKRAADVTNKLPAKAGSKLPADVTAKLPAKAKAKAPAEGEGNLPAKAGGTAVPKPAAKGAPRKAPRPGARSRAR